jgi:hypothetical protein
MKTKITVAKKIKGGEKGKKIIYNKYEVFWKININR